MTIPKSLWIPIVATATIVLTRLSLYTTEAISFNHYVYVSDFRWHHIHTGLVVIAFVLLFIRRRIILRNLGIGIGLGLALDEPNILLSWFGLPELPYWSPATFVLILTMLALTYLVTVKMDKTS